MNATYEEYRAAVEQAMSVFPLLGQSSDIVTDAPSVPPQEDEIPQPLKSAMRYSLTLPGKRLRPVLLLASYHMLQNDWRTVMPYALALEMIHTYSLIHDDLPAMDNDDLRRGKPTNHKMFGENVAILAGDGLYSLAFETMLKASLTCEKPELAVAAMEEIAVRAGVRGMIAGQTLDVKLEGAPPSPALVGYIHRHKTADLLTAPVAAGLTLAGASRAEHDAGVAYGQALGKAFQIVDDLLDVQGDAQTLGKQTGMDAQRGKMTWPAVFGVERSRLEAEQAIGQAVDALSAFGKEADFLRRLAQDTLTRVH
ncbi:MAG TPA: polyprenyl synthetase family protein [Candidatus Limiplasma sp.]|nr:polyprenyl synthetase family protein [Candidatus Limiplasma sp.]